MNRLRRDYRLVFLAMCFGTLLPCTTIPAQSQPESSVLVVESQDGGRSYELHTGDKMNYKPLNGQWQRGGTLQAVKDSSLVIGGKEIAFKEIGIMTQLRGSLRPIGTGLLIGGLVALPISFLIWMVSLLAALDNPSPGERALMLIMGVLTLVLLPIIVIVGLVMLIVGGKRFDLHMGWRIRKAN